MQQTFRSPVFFKGLGLHSGRPVRLTLRPASANYGIWFCRTDVTGADNMVPARWDAVVPSRLCTVIGNAAGTRVSTVEHLMAALAGLGVTNALVEIDGPEVPILDGSSAFFVAGILRRGLRSQGDPARVLRVLKPVEVTEGAAFARLEPAEMLEIHFAIDFEDAAIGKQSKGLTLSNGAFLRELSDARTFCRQSDVDMMQAQGLALGGSLDNAVVFDGDRVLSPGGLRHKDEPVRHKMLDAMGDLALAGGTVLGRYTGYRAGHALTNRLLCKLFATPGALRIEDALAGPMVAKLPGMGVSLDDLRAVA